MGHLDTVVAGCMDDDTLMAIDAIADAQLDVHEAASHGEIPISPPIAAIHAKQDSLLPSYESLPKSGKYARTETMRGMLCGWSATSIGYSTR